MTPAADKPTKALPCPWCGAPAYVICRSGELGEPWFVGCSDLKCNASGPIRIGSEAAVSEWNRVSHAIAPTPRKVEEVGDDG